MKIASGLTVLIIFALIAGIFPYKGESKSSKSFEELRREFKTWELKFGLMLLFIALLSTFLIKHILEFIASNSTAPEDSIYYVVQEPDIWYAPAAILGLAISTYLTQYFGRLLLRSRISEYHHYTNLKHGFDGKRIGKPLTWGLLVISTVVTYGYSNNFISIGEKGIIYHELRTISEKKYSYSEVEKIYFIENKKYDNSLVYEPYYYLEFSDGSVWNTLTGLSKYELNAEIFNYISVKANLELKTIPYLNK